ncbi:hypothetical protein B7P43_G10195 [Cryptotermes secundus]|uniref:Uncharacterized protein n=1 Tax=Cryptotermes secundus TaxID=105785 RepID=A0A2J7RDA8_9NEOP|nr:hypothetical protein B7P43_G10195 [Cryptotermes secundus]
MTSRKGAIASAWLIAITGWNCNCEKRWVIFKTLLMGSTESESKQDPGRGLCFLLYHKEGSNRVQQKTSTNLPSHPENCDFKL